jgi:hypothetical protein
MTTKAPSAGSRIEHQRPFEKVGADEDPIFSLYGAIFDLYPWGVAPVPRKSLTEAHRPSESHQFRPFGQWESGDDLASCYYAEGGLPPGPHRLPPGRLPRWAGFSACRSGVD